MSVNIIEGSIAPEIDAIEWLNTANNLSLQGWESCCDICISNALPWLCIT